MTWPANLDDVKHDEHMTQALFTGALAAAAHDFAKRTCTDPTGVEIVVDDNGDYEPHFYILLASGIRLHVQVNVAPVIIEENDGAGPG